MAKAFLGVRSSTVGIDAGNYGADPSNSAAENVAAFNAAFAAADVPVGEGDGLTVTCVKGGIYLVDDTIEIPYGVTIQFDRRVKLEYSGTGICLHFKDATMPDYRRFSTYQNLPYVYKTGTGWNTDPETDTTSVGIQVDYSTASIWHIGAINNFHRGLYLNGSVGLISYSQFHIGMIRDCEIGLHLYSDVDPQDPGDHFCTQNTFYGGTIYIQSNKTSNRTMRYIWINSMEGGVPGGGNLFENFNLEGATVDRAIDCNGRHNSWLGCRFEMSRDEAIYFGPNTESNIMISPLSLALAPWSSVIKDEGINNQILGRDARGTMKFATTKDRLLLGSGVEEPTNYLKSAYPGVIGVGGGITGFNVNGLVHTDSQLILEDNATPTVTGNVLKLEYAGATTITDILGVSDGTPAVATPELYVKLDDTSGTVAVDEAANHVCGLVGGASFDDDSVPGVAGRSLQLRYAVGEGLECGGDGAIALGTGDWSVAYWVKTTNTPVSTTADGNTHFDNTNDSNSIGIRAITNVYGGMYAYMNDAPSGGNQYVAWGAVDITDGQWHRIVFIRRGEYGELWIDGTMEDTDLHGQQSSLTSSGNFHIGAPFYAPYKSLDGAIDDFRIFLRALTTTEIATLSERGNATTIAVLPVNGNITIANNDNITTPTGANVVLAANIPKQMTAFEGKWYLHE